MDSGNSGSMQSSSGGEEEYDSRAEAISSFLNPTVHFGSISNQHHAPPSLTLSNHHHPPSLFDPPPLPHPFGTIFSQSPGNPDSSALYNLDSSWSRGLRSDPNFLEFGNLSGISSSLSSSTQSLLGGEQGIGQSHFPIPLKSIDRNNGARGSSQSQPDHQINVSKKSKKRTRASRRAPTTVLTTDTANFRQMVQEFTGIPAAPFSASPYARRLDLFGAGPLYPLRLPSAQISQYVSTPSLIDPIAPVAATDNTISSSNNFQTQNLLNIQNPILGYQSLLQAPLNHPLSNTPIHIGIKSPQAPTGADCEDTPSNGNDAQAQAQAQGRYKRNCSASMSNDFHCEKGLENVPSRGEGMDSWICPSD